MEFGREFLIAYISWTILLTTVLTGTKRTLRDLIQVIELATPTSRW